MNAEPAGGPSKAFVVNLLNANNASILTYQAVGTINTAVGTTPTPTPTSPTPTSPTPTSPTPTSPTPTPTPTPAQLPPQVLGNIAVKQSKKQTSYTISFAAPLNAQSAANPALFRVFQGVTKLVKRHKQTVFTRPLKIKSVVPGAGAQSVTLSLAKPFKGKVQVTIEPGLAGANGTSTGAAINELVP